ncbi:hypothetical protein CBOM_05304 [Ceraceosorus bombacis]|uniref:Uncharacterized protein n=1 Tax=Ceraceosorus bombacis TaxID=401625 RepID=A0A0N7LB72_9BASI|nr:hypothetical protein CBOM_05304 [Ceraceosorus bombacis]
MSAWHHTFWGELEWKNLMHGRNAEHTIFWIRGTFVALEVSFSKSLMNESIAAPFLSHSSRVLAAGFQQRNELQ